MQFVDAPHQCQVFGRYRHRFVVDAAPADAETPSPAQTPAGTPPQDRASEYPPDFAPADKRIHKADAVTPPLGAVAQLRQASGLMGT
jgi:hypothetical protein